MAERVKQGHSLATYLTSKQVRLRHVMRRSSTAKAQKNAWKIYFFRNPCLKAEIVLSRRRKKVILGMTLTALAHKGIFQELFYQVI